MAASGDDVAVLAILFEADDGGVEKWSYDVDEGEGTKVDVLVFKCARPNAPYLLAVVPSPDPIAEALPDSAPPSMALCLPVTLTRPVRTTRGVEAPPTLCLKRPAALVDADMETALPGVDLAAAAVPGVPGVAVERFTRGVVVAAS